MCVVSNPKWWWAWTAIQGERIAPMNLPASLEGDKGKVFFFAGLITQPRRRAVVVEMQTNETNQFMRVELGKPRQKCLV